VPGSIRKPAVYDQAEPKQQQVAQVAFLTHETLCLFEAAARFLHPIQFLAGEEAVVV